MSIAFAKKVFTAIVSYAIIIPVIKMSQNKDNFKRGTAELLILHLLQKEDLYGYQITKLFNEIAPKYAERNGGYTRIIKIGPRRGDAAEMSILELV